MNLDDLFYQAQTYRLKRKKNENNMKDNRSQISRNNEPIEVTLCIQPRTMKYPNTREYEEVLIKVGVVFTMGCGPVVQ